MAVQNIKDAWDNLEFGLWQELSGGKGRQAAGARFAHIIRVHEDTFVSKTTEAINAIATRMGADPQIARYSDVQAAYSIVTNAWLARTGMTGVTAEILGGLFLIRREDTSKKWSEGKVNRRFRGAVYNIWRQALPDPHEAPRATDKVPGTKSPEYKGGQVDRDVLTTTGRGMDQSTGSYKNDPLVFEGTGFSHDRGQVDDMGKHQQSNLANAAFLAWMEQQQDPIQVEMGELMTIDVVSWVMEKLNVNWKQVQNPDTGVMEWVVTGELAGDNPPGGTEDLVQKWEDKLLLKFEALLTSDESFLKNADFKASERFTNKIADKETRKIINEYLKVGGVKVKNVPKKPKKSSRTGNIKPKKRGNPVSKKALQRAPKGGIVVGGKAYKGGQFLPGNEQGVRFAPDGYTGTAVSMELARLKAFINSNLNEEVTRNMGRPALTWQTGRFAQSVRLLSLQQAENTVMAKYTYLLRPYETFENTGKRRWPLGYNPKPLITRSIRNLAKGRIAQKLNFRRV